MTPEAQEKKIFINIELNNYKKSLDRFHITIHMTSLTPETEMALEKEAEALIKSKLKTRIEELEKDLEAL